MGNNNEMYQNEDEIIRFENEVFKRIPVLKPFIDYAAVPATEQEASDEKLMLGKECFQQVYIYGAKHLDEAPVIAAVIEKNLEKMDILKACAAGHMCGAFMEKTGNFNLGYGLIDTLERVVKTAYGYLLAASQSGIFPGTSVPVEKLLKNALTPNDYASMFKAYPEEAKAIKGAQFITLAVMDVITRKKEMRDYFKTRDLYGKIIEVQNFLPSTVYTLMAEDCCSNVKTLVLNPKTRRGCYVNINDINNFCHIVTLLEAEFFKAGISQEYGIAGYNFDQNVYEAAIGMQYPAPPIPVNAHAVYLNMEALNRENADKNWQNIDAAKYTAFKQGTALEQMPSYKGCPVIVAVNAPEAGDYKWDTTMTFVCHEGLKAGISILQQLSENEVTEIINEIITPEEKAPVQENVLNLQKQSEYETANMNNDDRIYEEEECRNKILEVLKNKLNGSIREKDFIYVPSLNINIFIDSTLYRDSYMTCEFVITRPSFIEEFKEFTAVIDGNFNTAAEKLADSFIENTLDTVKKVLFAKPDDLITIIPSYELSQDNIIDEELMLKKKKFKIFYGNKVYNGNGYNFDQNADYYMLLKDLLIKHLGNKPVYWIKIYVSKYKDNIECECRINNRVSAELTEILKQTAAGWPETETLSDVKQYIALEQDVSTYVPCNFEKNYVLNTTERAVSILKDIRNEEQYQSRYENIYEICKNYNFTSDLTDLIPEVMSECLLEQLGLKNSETFTVALGSDIRIVYKDAFTYYNWIQEAVENILAKNELTAEEKINIVKTAAIFKSVQQGLSSDALENINSMAAFQRSVNYRFL